MMARPRLQSLGQDAPPRPSPTRPLTPPPRIGVNGGWRGHSLRVSLCSPTALRVVPLQHDCLHPLVNPSKPSADLMCSRSPPVQLHANFRLVFLVSTTQSIEFTADGYQVNDIRLLKWPNSQLTYFEIVYTVVYVMYICKHTYLNSFPALARLVHPWPLRPLSLEHRLLPLLAERSNFSLIFFLYLYLSFFCFFVFQFYEVSSYHVPAELRLAHQLSSAAPCGAVRRRALW